MITENKAITSNNCLNSTLYTLPTYYLRTKRFYNKNNSTYKLYVCSHAVHSNARIIQSELFHSFHIACNTSVFQLT